MSDHDALRVTIEDNERLHAELEAMRADKAELLAALREALAMVETFASGAGFSYSGRAEFDRLAAIAKVS